ncbi:hypothetical protein OHB12_23750 [Nocardia sp. NBC_01730]|uniref:hypothetical protein n=1 Tax=Nocardia sp. NBC_01730 TaxID=2975998 RepID=UPI002E145C36|nr:hypothetical protein OHB12_23750 [Nocardia sp. NBC_01730]
MTAAIGQGFVGVLLGALGLGFGGVIIGVLVIVVVAVKRRGSKRRGWCPPSGRPVE